MYEIIEACSPGPYLELFARGSRPRWEQWGNQVEDYVPTWPTYANHSQREMEDPQQEEVFTVNSQEVS